LCIDVIRAEDVEGWLAGEYDWEDTGQRHSVFSMPTEVPSSERELRATRFFVNSVSRRELM